MATVNWFLGLNLSGLNRVTVLAKSFEQESKLFNDLYHSLREKWAIACTIQSLRASSNLLHPVGIL